jgi:D-amino-acid dehydrogenase
MPAETVDAIVLGAGFVGVSAALALQARGRRVALVDRHSGAAGETSFGNAGIVQTEAVIPYVFPRAPRDIARGALNLDPRAHIRYGALPSIAPGIWRYFAASTPSRKNATARAMAPFLARASAEHLEFARQAGAEALLRRGGWIKAFRSARGEDMANKEAEELKPYGIAPKFLDRNSLIALEPHLSEAAIGGAH